MSSTNALTGCWPWPPPTFILEEVRKILETAPDLCDYPVGVLTSEHRDSWAKTREELLLGVCVGGEVRE